MVYRPWGDWTVPGLAAQYSAERRYFLGTYGAIAYLGERVARQHSSDTFVVPAPSPRHKFYPARLLSMSEGAGTPWRSCTMLCGGATVVVSLVPVPAEDVAVRFFSFYLLLSSPQVILY